jgi:hypothetical protein
MKRLYEKSGDQITTSVIVEAEPRFAPYHLSQAVQTEPVAEVRVKPANTRTIADLVQTYHNCGTVASDPP